jgi:murein DD-endopeptidase MepM/ murein hydrolase activator NlpD
VKLYVFGPSAILSLVFALSSYAPQIDENIRVLIDGPDTQQTAAAALPVAPDAVETQAAGDEPDEDSVASSPEVVRKITIRKGDSLGEALARADFSGDEQPRVLAALTKVFDAYDLKPGQVITVTFEKDSGGQHFANLEMMPDVQRTISLTANQNGTISAEVIKSALSTVTRAVAGKIEGSLYESAVKQKLPQPILAAFIRAYSYNVDFQRDLQPGDRFQILYQIVVNDKGELVKPGNILVASLTLSGKDQRIYLNQTSDGTLDFFSADGKSIRKTLLRTPIDGAKITSGFGMRIHPLLGYSKMHKGVDFGAPTGTPVFAAGDGVVEKMGWWGGYGRYLRIRHNSEIGTAYAHLSRFPADLQEGSHVRQGQIVAYTGSTGAATGPHLHYEVLKNGTQVNPLAVTTPLGNMLGGKDLVQFRHLIEERDRMLKNLTETPMIATRTVSTQKIQ